MIATGMAPLDWRQTLALAIACALVASLHAEELAPELAPLVGKHKSDLSALDSERTETRDRKSAGPKPSLKF